ncbi:unnamed protein product [Prunus armeniaca]
MKAEIKQVGTQQFGQAKKEPKASDGGAKAPASKAAPKKAAPKPQAPKKKMWDKPVGQGSMPTPFASKFESPLD